MNAPPPRRGQIARRSLISTARSVGCGDLGVAVFFALGVAALSSPTERRLTSCDQAQLLVAFLKVYFIGIEFMELRGAPSVPCGGFAAWAVIVATAVTSLYLL